MLKVATPKCLSCAAAEVGAQTRFRSRHGTHAIERFQLLLVAFFTTSARQREFERLVKRKDLIGVGVLHNNSVKADGQ